MFTKFYLLHLKINGAGKNVVIKGDWAPWVVKATAAGNVLEIRAIWRITKEQHAGLSEAASIAKLNAENGGS
jgi:hypothetical protein